ncbi:MAG: S24 family peptidase [Alphaproteobacteria bacterium]|nr:S24 family peptidase [Alphaproteobacteria bacterium]
MGTTADRVRQRMAELDITQDRLAGLCGTTQPSIYRLLSGQIRNPHYIYELAKALETSVKWLKTGVSDAEYPAPPTLPGGLSDAPRTAQAGKIPVWGTIDAQGGDRYSFNSEETPIDWITPLPAQLTDKDAFAMAIGHTSMEPMFYAGWIACIHTRKPVIRGKPVAIWLKNGEGLLKIYQGDDGEYCLLKQLNPEKTLKIKKSAIYKIMPVVGTIL